MLVYYDLLKDKEVKRVEVDFQPTLLTVQGARLFAGTKGAATVHVLDAETGKESKAIKVPGEPLQALACHPAKGLLYGVNTNNEVYAIDPDKATATKTKAKGQLLAIDADGKHVYTGIQKPIKDAIVLERGDGGKTKVYFAQDNLRAMMLKYAVEDSDLKLEAVNDNAAINGRGLCLSPDGKRIAMAGGGGWRSQTDPKANYSVAVFDTEDMTSLLGQVETGPYPSAAAFHPVLNLGVAYRDNVEAGELLPFNAKSFAKKGAAIKTSNGGSSATLLFGGQGTKVIFVGQGVGPLNKEAVVEIYPLPLTDQDKEALKKAYPK
jgi:outer membrane protein assembly factor BamB